VKVNLNAGLTSLILLSAFRSAPVWALDIQKQIDSMIQLQYDPKVGGWSEPHKFLDRNFIEYALKAQPKLARQTLDAAQSLVDRVWGGAFEYSSQQNWTDPQYEKTAKNQADFIWAYALAYADQKDESDLKIAKAVIHYVDTFLTTTDGVFEAGQAGYLVRATDGKKYFQADDAERKAQGLPAIDQNVYAQANGELIEALTFFYEMTGDEVQLKKAEHATEWILKNRAMASAVPLLGFQHGEKTNNMLWLGDTLAMARGFLELYQATANRDWLKDAENSAKYIDFRFKNSKGLGFVTQLNPAKKGKASPDAAENLALGRLTHLLYEYTGEMQYQKMAEHALAYLRTPAVYHRIEVAAGVKLFLEEMQNPPIHLTIVGKKSDPKAKELFLAALQYPSAYKRVEWWDRGEGPLPRGDVQYPELKEAAAFACAEKRCSLPAYQADQIHNRIDRMIKN
jgi:uncharacterized protein YyaL (SSP411 family)